MGNIGYDYTIRGVYVLVCFMNRDILRTVHSFIMLDMRVMNTLYLTSGYPIMDDRDKQGSLSGFG